MNNPNSDPISTRQTVVGSQSMSSRGWKYDGFMKNGKNWKIDIFIYLYIFVYIPIYSQRKYRQPPAAEPYMLMKPS